MSMPLTVQQRRKQLALASVTGLFLLAVTLVLINIMAYWLFIRMDLTRSRTYSLSPASRRLVRQLEDPVVIKAFFTPDLPPPYNVFGRYARDILTEYRSASGGRVRFDFVSPVSARVFEQQAAAANLQPIQFEEAGASQLKIRRGYMGLELFHRDRSEILPVVKDVQTLEYDITSRIAKMAQRRKKTIAVASGHGETRWQTPQSRLSQNLEALYEFQDFPLPAVSTPALQADALLIVGPNQKFDDRSLWAIDQAIMRGIPAVFLIDVKKFAPDRFMVFAADTGLPDLLRHYGIQLGDRLVYDSQCQAVGFTQNLSGLSFTTNIPFPYIPSITGFDSKHPLMRGLEAFALPFPVTVQPSGQPGAGRFMPLFSSSRRSWLAPAQTLSVAPTNIPKPAPDDPQGPFILGAFVEGPFASYFQSKPIPAPGQALIGTSPKTPIFVMGTSHLLDPQLPDFPGSEALISNLLAYLTQDEILIGIHPKGGILRPLKPVRPILHEASKAIGLLGGAVLAVVWGLTRWRRRRAWRQAIAGLL